MRLTPKEQEKLMLHQIGLLARERMERGLKLNYVEAMGFLCSELLEAARDGHTVTELMVMGRSFLTENDVMDGIADLIQEVQVEATFPDGTKLVTVHEPIGPSVSSPVITADENIILNEGRKTKELLVSNTGDRPVQVGSHYHFYEVNDCLAFDRESALGCHLDIPSGTSVRFEPGEEKEVRLVAMGGKKIVHGFRDQVCGPVKEEKNE